MTDVQIEASILRRLGKLRATAPSPEELQKRYLAAKHGYTKAVTESVGGAYYSGMILQNYAEKEACKRYARENNIKLEE